MDNVKFGLFDLFVYTVPGIVLLFAIYLPHINICLSVDLFITDLNKFISNVNFGLIFLLVFTSYLLGFVLHYFGFKYFIWLAPKIWYKRFAPWLKNRNHSEIKYVIVRHHTKANFAFVDQWNAYRGMSFNLSLAFFLIGIEIVIKCFNGHCFRKDWIFFFMILIIMSFVTLRRAVTFHFWSLSTLEEAFNMFNQSQVSSPDSSVEPSKNGPNGDADTGDTDNEKPLIT